MRPNRYTFFSTALLALVFALPAQAQYGSGVVIEVPQATGTITLDGDASEADWEDAAVVDLTANWDGGFYDCNTSEVPDIVALGQLLWADGALYVYVLFEDYELYFGNPDLGPFPGDQIYVGVDLTHMGDAQVDSSFAGWPDNAPDLGPVSYKATGAPDVGIRTGYFEFDAVAEGYVDGVVFVDEASQTWGVEMAILGDEIVKGGEIGFNIGGAAGTEACGDEKGDAYAYFSWQVCDPPEGFCGLPGGTINSSAASFATLSFAGSVANEPGATAIEGYTLDLSGANPFRGATTLAYELPRAGQVALAVYDVLGRQMAVLDAGARAAGEHTAVFDASALPGGVYVVRLAVDGAVVATRRAMHVH